MAEEFIDDATGEVVRLGLVEGLSNDDYHAAVGYSSSQVRKFGEQSPLHYWWETEGQAQAKAEAGEEEEEDEESADLIFGTATHAAVMEPDLFSDVYRKFPMPFNARTKAGRAYRDEFIAQCKSDGKIALSADDMAACWAIRKRIHGHPVASAFFRDGAAEQSYFTLDKSLGVVKKCRPDYLNGLALTDLKTAKSANKRVFFRDAVDKGYDLAVPWYLDILEELYGEAPKNFVWVVAEKKPPYALGIYYAQPDDIARARITMRRWFERLVECRRTNHWPDWAEEVQPFEVPRYVQRGE